MAKDVIDRDRGMDEVLRLVREMQTHPPHVVVGVTGGQHHSGQSLPEIAAIHEFGAGNVPERSFLRATIDANQKEYMSRVRSAFDGGLVRAANDQMGAMATTDAALKRLALKVQGDVRKRIADGIPPANSPATVKKKGSSTPLVDTGQLRASITAVVRRGPVR